MCAALTLVALYSCSHSETIWVTIEDCSDLDPAKSFIPYSVNNSMMSPEAIMKCSLPGGGTVEEAARDEDTKTTSTNGAGLIRAMVSMIDSKEIISYSGCYKSEDEDGNPIRVSGRISIPAKGRISRIMLVSHYTIGHNSEAPSNEVTIESMFAARGFAVVQADYVGYGQTSDRVHPYLCDKVTARNVIDMYYASLPFLKKIRRTPDHDDIFLMGFSQGGAVTMSVAQLLEASHPDVKIRLTMAGGGPYDICATYDKLIENDFTDYPCAIPMIIQGMDYGNDLNLDYSDYFLPRMVENLDEWINSKRYTMGDITQLIGSKKVSSIMTPDAMDKTSPKMTKLYNAMLDNSVIGKMMPRCPIYLFHSLDDTVVPYVNAYNIMEMLEMQDCNVMYNFGHYGPHQIATLRFFLSCDNLLRDFGDIQ